jgi:hypothetical protein
MRGFYCKSAWAPRGHDIVPEIGRDIFPGIEHVRVHECRGASTPQE